MLYKWTHLFTYLFKTYIVSYEFLFSVYHEACSFGLYGLVEFSTSRCLCCAGVTVAPLVEESPSAQRLDPTSMYAVVHFIVCMVVIPVVAVTNNFFFS